MSQERMNRAIRQRLLMLQEEIADGYATYSVCGATGNIYQVQIHHEDTSCTCHDFVYRQLPCKHIYFILNNVLGFSPVECTNSDYTSVDRLQEKLNNRSNKLERLLHSEKDENKEEKKEKSPDGAEYTRSGRLRQPIEDSDCPICLEPMDKKEGILFCQTECGANVHVICMERWSRMNRKWMCPLCRSNWDK